MSPVDAPTASARWLQRAVVLTVCLIMTPLTVELIGAGIAHASGTFSVLSYGAVGDGATNDRAAIQSAINAAYDAGGGTVELPYRSSCSNGDGVCDTFLSGNLVLGSHVTLQIDSGVTLEQSSYAGQGGGRNDYTYTPALGKIPSSDIYGDLNMFHNQPFIYAAGVTNVAVTGGAALGGTIEMASQGDTQPYLAPIGLYEVNGYTISNLHIDDGDTYNICLFTTENGTVSGNQIAADGIANTDGVSIQNSQHVTVTENSIDNGDDGIYVWASYDDPRGGSWWSTAAPQASTDITISHNVLTGSPGHGLTLIPWGTGAPDLRDVVISDVSFLDNTSNDSYGFGCWCEDAYDNDANSYGNPGLPQGYVNVSPMQDITFSGNDYNGDSVTSVPQTISDLQADDWPAPSATNEWSGDSPTVFMNGGFEDEGMTYWDSVGPPSDVGATDGYSVGQDGSWYGYLQYFSAGYEALYQGLTLNAGDDYTFQLRTESSGKPFRMFIYDTCNGDVLANTTFSNTSWQTQSVSLSVPSGESCTDYHVGVDDGVSGYTYSRSDWVRIDDASLIATSGTSGEPAVILASNPENSYSQGGWSTGTYSGDIDGTDSYSCAAGTWVNVPFIGAEARLIAATASNLGDAAVYVDGTFVTTIDLHSASTEFQQYVFDTGPLAYGRHTVELNVDSGSCVDLNAVEVGTPTT